MKHKPKFQKFIIIFVVIIIAAIFLMIYFRIGTLRSAPKRGASHSSPVAHSGQIFLYGEEHAAEAILKKEFELWSTYYHDDGMRDLFVELPYYSAEFLNLEGQVFVIEYTKTDGSVIREYHRADGNTWQGSSATEEFKLSPRSLNR